MAAHSELPVAQIVELSDITTADLDPLLAEEIDVWRERFTWDFRPSADLLRRFVQIRSLYGCAIRLNGEVAGYAYFVCEGHKGLIGDFFVRRRYATSSLETQLLRAVVESLMRTTGIRRIESQLMMLRAFGGEGLPSFGRRLARYERYFMEIDRGTIRRLAESSPRSPVRFVAWAERHMEDMAHLLAASYRGHIDSELNDQYRSISGARQFLSNIIRFPGCGRFSPEASLLALDANTGRLSGMCLASRVSAEAGHVTQVCVLPALRGSGIGYELIRQTTRKLVETDATVVSLTVTCANAEAVRLYRSVGFRVQGTFPALVWDRF
jgi:ribosomal protein S18 acetylase RimI-like enzyme